MKKHLILNELDPYEPTPEAVERFRQALEAAGVAIPPGEDLAAALKRQVAYVCLVHVACRRSPRSGADPDNATSV